MSVMDVIRARHSVRSYEERGLSNEEASRLQGIVSRCAEESGLNIQLVTDNPEAFQVIARFGVIRGASAHVAFVAKGVESDEAIGYWGQRIVLAAQEMGLNTCWVMLMARKKSKAKVPAGMGIRIGIAVGYGKTQGTPHKSKPAEELIAVEGDTSAPQWFKTAGEAAMLAPTAVNHQNFRITLLADDQTVRAETKPSGTNVIDLGIVKRNFEEAANETGAVWKWER